jgi:hypothetical protein
MTQKRKLDNYDDDYDCDTESLSSFESDEVMKTLFTVYQAQNTIQAMRKIFRVFDSGVN